jgi:hypothetical protein
MPVLEKAVLALILVASVVFAVQSLDIRPPAQSFPLVVSVLTGTLAAFALARSVARPLSPPIFFAGRAGLVLASAAGFVGYVLILPIGYITSTLAFLFLGYLYLMPERTPRSILIAAAVALAATAFTWLCFSYWLGVNLPAFVSLPIPSPDATRL